MKRGQGLIIALLVCAAGVAAWWLLPRADTIQVGSKAFTESVVLGDTLVQVLEEAGFEARHDRAEMQGQLAWLALNNGEIDLYIEYTGTLTEELLIDLDIQSDAQLDAALAERGLKRGPALGFHNNYALGMREAAADELGIRAISDLARHPELRIRFSTAFMARNDCWPTLRVRYNLPQQDVRGIEHNLAYTALANGSCDVTDVYTTDGQIEQLNLRVLEDDLGHFPAYEAFVLHRADLEERYPGASEALAQLSGQIDETRMTKLNAAVQYEGRQPAEAAASFLSDVLGGTYTAKVESKTEQLVRNAWEHLWLVAVSLGAAIVMALPLGVAAAKLPHFGQVILAGVGIVQTIPSLALLAFMIPLLGTGVQPAIVALFLYSLLPIVRNTATGLHSIPPSLRDSAIALGLPAKARLWRVELPMATRSILAGIKISAVINVGTAALGGFVGAGGFGQPIVTGLSRVDKDMIIWQGAVPASILALAVQGIFELAERRLVPKGLRSKPSG